MKKDKFQEAVRLNNQKDHLLKVKEIISGDLLELVTGFPSKSVIIKGTLLKKIRKIVDEEILEVDQKIENL